MHTYSMPMHKSGPSTLFHSGMLRMPSRGKITKVLAATRPWRRQCISPSHTERRESLAPYRKKSRMMAASLKRLNTVSHTPEQGIRIPALTLTMRPTVKRSNLERNPGMEEGRKVNAVSGSLLEAHGVLLAQAQNAAGGQLRHGGGVRHLGVVQLDGAGREMLLAQNAVGLLHLENVLKKRKATRASAFMPAGREAISTSGKSAAARSLLEKRVSQSARAASAAAES